MLNIALIASATILADLPPIETMAPASSFVILTADDVNASWNAIRAGQLGKLYDDPKVQEFVKGDGKSIESALDEAAKNLGIERKDFVLPGRVGGALFTERDAELDALITGFIFVADFDDRADAGAKMLQAAFESGAKESGVTIEKQDLDGKEVWVLPMGDDEADEVEEEDEMGGVGIGMGMSAFGSGPEAIYYMRDGEHVLMASSMANLEEALLSTHGKGKGKTLSGTEDWQGTSALLGKQDASVTLLMGPMKEAMGPMLMGPMAMVQPAVDALFGDIRGAAFGANLSANDTIIEGAAAVFIPGKKVGLVSLLSNGHAISAPPKMLGDECASFTSINFNFHDLWKVVESVVASLPEMEAEQIAPTLTIYEPIVSKAFTVMGPSIYGATWTDANADSGVRSVYTIACTNEKAGMPMLQMFAPAAGLMPRDFQGATIFSGDLVPVSIGLGSGQVLVGESEAVEQVLRAAADKDAKGLTEFPLYKRCSALLPSGAHTAWGFSDTAGMVDAQRTQLKNLAGADLAADGFVDDAGNPIDEIITDKAVANAMAMADKVDSEMVRKYLGPNVWWVTPNGRGFTARTRLLMP